MTQKRYVKLLMAAGADRNTAQRWALANRLSRYAYSEMAETDATTARVIRAFYGNGVIRCRPAPIRPIKRTRTDGFNTHFSLIDEWDGAGGGHG